MMYHWNLAKKMLRKQRRCLRFQNSCIRRVKKTFTNVKPWQKFPCILIKLYVSGHRLLCCLEKDGLVLFGGNWNDSDGIFLQRDLQPMLNISGKQNRFGIYPKSFVQDLKDLERRVFQNSESPRLNSMYIQTNLS